MDKLEQIGKLVVAALFKARELSKFTLEPELKGKVSELVKAAKDSSRKIEALAEVTAKNGQLDKANCERCVGSNSGCDEERER